MESADGMTAVRRSTAWIPAAAAVRDGSSAGTVRRVRRATRRIPRRSARSTNGGEYTRGVAFARPEARPVASILLQHANLRHILRRRSPPAPRRLRRSARRGSGCAASTTCSSRSASRGLRQRRAERRDEIVREVADEADGVRQHDRLRRRARGAGAASCRASRTAGWQRRRAAPVRRLKSVDLPAFV